jgi:hypothetical protein
VVPLLVYTYKIYYKKKEPTTTTKVYTRLHTTHTQICEKLLQKDGCCVTSFFTYQPWLLLAPTSYSTTFLLLTSLRRTPLSDEVAELKSASAKRSDRVFHYALSYLPVINPSCATFLPLGFTVFGSFSKELCALFDRFTTIIFEREQDSFCRSLCSIRKYHLKSWYVVILLYIYYFFWICW